MSEKDRREPLFQHLDSVLKVSQKKFKTSSRENTERIRWGNLIIKAVHEYGFLLKSDELELRVRELEEKYKDGVFIPNEQSKQKNQTARR